MSSAEPWRLGSHPLNGKKNLYRSRSVDRLPVVVGGGRTESLPESHQAEGASHCAGAETCNHKQHRSHNNNEDNNSGSRTGCCADSTHRAARPDQADFRGVDGVHFDSD